MAEREESRAKSMAIGLVVAALVVSLELLRRVLTAGEVSLAMGGVPLFRIDRLSAAPMVLFTVLALVTLLAAPRRDRDGRFFRDVALILGGTLAAYAAANLVVFFLAWVVATLRSSTPRPARLAVALLLAGGVALAETGVSAPAALALIVLAAVLHMGLFPFQRFTIGAFDRGPMSLAALAMNAQLGVYLIARVGTQQFPDLAPAVLPWLSGLALVTCLYMAVLGVAERDPRRLLATLLLSQSAALLAAIASGSPRANTGALLQWLVTGLASTALVCIYRGVEARIGGNPGPLRFLGLAAQAPRLAVFFAVSGLALIGLPGTLGFAGQYLMVHGMLSAHSWWGAALPVAIGLNAYHVFMLFTHLFLGKPVFSRSSVVDALPRERWALAALVVLLVCGGLAPGRVAALYHAVQPLDVQFQAISSPRK